MRGKITKAWVWKDPIQMPHWVMILVEFEDESLFGLTFEGGRASQAHTERMSIDKDTCSWERVL